MYFRVLLLGGVCVVGRYFYYKIKVGNLFEEILTRKKKLWEDYCDKKNPLQDKNTSILEETTNCNADLSMPNDLPAIPEFLNELCLSDKACSLSQQSLDQSLQVLSEIQEKYTFFLHAALLYLVCNNGLQM